MIKTFFDRKYLTLNTKNKHTYYDMIISFISSKHKSQIRKKKRKENLPPKILLTSHHYPKKRKVRMAIMLTNGL